MAWIGTGRAAMFSEIEKLCKQMEDEAREEVNQQRIQIWKEADREHMNAAKKYEAEISSLNTQIASLKAALERSTAVPQPTSSTMATQDAAMKKLRSRYDDAKKHLVEVIELATKRKKEALRWAEYADSLELKIQQLEKKLAGRGTKLSATPNQLPTLPAADAPETSVQGPSRPNLSFTATPSFPPSMSETDAGDGQGDSDDVQLPSWKAMPKTVTRRDPAAETVEEGPPGSTQSDPSQPQLPIARANEAAMQSKTSSDGPEVVWERPVKRVRREEQENARPSTPRVNTIIKRELSESQPQGLGTTISSSQESMDLDEGQLSMPTPRKRQLVYHDVSSSEADEASAPGEDDIPAPSGDDRTPRPQPAAAALTPLSVNVRRMVQSNGQKDVSRSAKQLERGADFLEDNGGQMNTPGATKAARLQLLLNSQSAQPSPILSTRRPVAGTALLRGFGQPPPARTLPRVGGGTATSRSKGTDREVCAQDENVATPTPKPHNADGRITTPLTQALRAAAAERTSKKDGLRCRHVDQLRLEDFKINPDCNNGKTFAFSEVVRSRADRRNLAGCTDLQCCGKAFRGMAESELSAAGPCYLLRTENVALMERFLGNEAFVMARMSPDERRELWIAAKTKQLADKYGKHRHRFHRQASPPGFWNADFPTTEEEEEHRVEAERAERVAVQERYREAMQPNGRWLFRDE